MSQNRSPLRATLVAATTAGLCALALTGCGSGGDSATPSAPTTAARAGGGAAGGGPGEGPGGGRVPGVAGMVAAVDGTTLQVQGDNEQTAVVYTAKTKVTARVATTASVLAVGSCVSVRTADRGAAPSTSPTAANGGGTGGAAATPTGPLAATSVTVLAAKGGCPTGGGMGDGGGFPGGAGGPMPSGAPSGMPSGAPSGPPPGMPAGGPPAGGGGFGGFGTFGEVTAVGSGTFTVASVLPGRPPASGTATPSPSASVSPRPVEVTWAADTTFLTTSTARATAAKVGTCVRATGTTDDTGTLTATTLVVSPPVDGSCTSGVRGG